LTEPFDRLLALQGRDTAIDQLRHRARSLPEREALRDVSARLKERESALGGVAEQVEELAARQRLLEEQIGATRDRRHELERRMRTGTGYSTRDLQAMDHEINQLADRQAGLEDDELALLEEEEPLDSVLAEQASSVDGLVQERARLEVAIAESEAAIAAEIETQQSARAELAAGLPVDLLTRYETLRERKGGVGAAALVGNRCDGCHLELPAVDLDRIRRLPADEVVLCPECDRILVR
jgi:predicted  nucleic acid-binding Zn-ribbon protein